MKASSAFLCVVAITWSGMESEGANLRTAVVEKLGCSYTGGGPIVETSQFCYYNSGGYAINNVQLYQNDNCECNYSGSCMSTSDITSCTTTPGCFEVGSTFTVWVNADLAPCSYQVPWTFKIAPFTNDVTLNSGGILPYSMTSWISQGAAAPPANAGVLVNLLPCCTEGQANCASETCTAENAQCVTCQTEAGWSLISSGDTYTLQTSVSWSSTSSKTTSQTTTKTIQASVGVQYDGVSASSSYTQSVADTVSSTFSTTNGGSTTSTEQISCNDGALFQWVVTVTQSFPGIPDQVTTVSTANYVCVPSDSSAVSPSCPPGYCGNLGQTGDAAGCQCCKNLDWTSDASQVSNLLCPS